MPGKPYKDKDGNVIEFRSNRTTNLTVSVYRGDQELIEWMQAYLGTNKSEVVRSAVRAFATHLAYLSGSRLPGGPT